MMQTLNEEGKKKRRAIVIAVAAVMIVAAVGVGFAVNYLGSVDNTSNDTDERYYIVSLDVDKDGTYDEASDFTDAFSGFVYFDTVNSSAGVTYTAHDVTTIDGSSCVLLKSINVKVHGPADLTAYDDYELAITHAHALTQSFKMQITVAGTPQAGDFDSAAGEGYTINATGAQETIFTVNLYMVVSSPTTTAPDAIIFSGETFSFEVTATA